MAYLTSVPGDTEPYRLVCEPEHDNAGLVAYGLSTRDAIRSQRSGTPFFAFHTLNLESQDELATSVLGPDVSVGPEDVRVIQHRAHVTPDFDLGMIVPLWEIGREGQGDDFDRDDLRSRVARAVVALVRGDFTIKEHLAEARRPYADQIIELESRVNAQALHIGRLQEVIKGREHEQGHDHIVQREQRLADAPDIPL